MTLISLAPSPRSSAQPGTMACAHLMVSRLLDGALGRLARAEHELPAGSGESLAAATAIIAALQDSLDLEMGGQLAGNLYDLYDYMLRRLGAAAPGADPEPLREVASLLEIIQQGWEAIAPEVANASL